MSKIITCATPLERRLARRLEARKERGLAECLLRLKGVEFGGRFRFESLYAVGGEGAVYLVRDVKDSSGPVRVAKVALHPLHRPFEMDGNLVRKNRYGLRVEAQYLASSVSPFLPAHVGTYEFQNPLLDEARGDAFSELEPVLVMEKLPGRDLDVWLARMHEQRMPQQVMRRTLDRVAVVLLQALVDLRDRGYFYADLRPANLRMMGRPERRIRLLDAGSLVAVHDRSGRFPHVPAYLSPGAYDTLRGGRTILPGARLQGIMAGRTLFEAATGRVPLPGQPVDLTLLKNSNVSPPVADVIDGLCRGDFDDVGVALKYLYKRARRRVSGGNDPAKVSQITPTTVTEVAEPAESVTDSAASPDARGTSPASDAVLPPPSRPRGLLGRLFGWLRG